MENSVTFIPVILPDSNMNTSNNSLESRQYKNIVPINKQNDFDSIDKICLSQCINGTQLKALKMPTSEEVIKGLTLIPVILETGKQILIGIFDLRNIWNERSGNSDKNNIQTVSLPNEEID